MEFTAKVLRAFEARYGTNASGEDWSVQSFYFEEYGRERPESIVVDVWDLKLREWLLRNIGATVTIYISTKAKEYQGRMFNNLACRRISHLGKDVISGQPTVESIFQPQPQPTQQAQQPAQTQATAQPKQQTMNAFQDTTQEEGEELPF